MKEVSVLLNIFWCAIIVAILHVLIQKYLFLGTIVNHKYWEHV